jgi:hypothetical protein
MLDVSPYYTGSIVQQRRLLITIEFTARACMQMVDRRSTELVVHMDGHAKLQVRPVDLVMAPRW